MPAAPAPGKKTSGKAIVSLIFGLLSLCCPCVAALVSILFGFLSIGDINRAPQQVSGKALAIIGMMLSVLTFPIHVVGGYFGYRFSEGLVAANLRKQSSNNLKQVSIATQNFASANLDRLPGATINGPTGDPTLSWRVTLMPYVEEDVRYRKFRLDEAWDSATNRPLLDPIPMVYRDPYRDPKSIDTPYLVFVGPGTLFSGPGNSTPYTVANIPDGTSNTILAVEATEGVPWSSPKELPYTADGPLPSLGNSGSDVFLAAMLDGSVKTVKKTVSPKTLRSAINPADGVPLGADW